MIEPTESFEKEELDRFIDVMRKIAKEVNENPNEVLEAPKNAAVNRLNEAKASHPKTMSLSWKMHLRKTSY